MREIRLWLRRRIIRDMDTDGVVATEATGARTRVDDTHMFRWWKTTASEVVGRRSKENFEEDGVYDRMITTILIPMGGVR